MASGTCTTHTVSHTLHLDAIVPDVMHDVLDVRVPLLFPQEVISHTESGVRIREQPQGAVSSSISEVGEGLKELQKEEVGDFTRLLIGCQ